MNNRDNNENSEKRERQIKQQIIHLFISIVEAYPILRVTQHLDRIMSKEGAYHFSNEKFLSELEKYQDKLDKEYDELFEKEDKF